MTEEGKSVSDGTRTERIKLELSVWLEEYKALRAEIVATLTAAYGATALTMTAIAALVAGSSFVFGAGSSGQNTATNGRVILFAVAPLVLYGLLWAQFRYALAVLNMSNHISDVISLNVQECLKELRTDERNVRPLLTWEARGRTANHPREFLLYPIEAARFIVPVIAAIVSLGVYVFSTWARIADRTVENTWKGFGWEGLFFVALNFSLLIYTIIAGINVRSKLASGTSPGGSSAPTSDVADSEESTDSASGTGATDTDEESPHAP